MDIATLKETFMTLCRPLADRGEVLDTQFEDGKKSCIFNMVLRSARIQLVYCWKWETLAPPSVLYCRVYLNKNVPIYLHLPELITALEAQDFRACYFPCIENRQRMKACFDALMAIVDDYIPKIEAISQNGQSEQIMELRFREDFWGNRMDDSAENHWNYHNSEDRAIMESFDRMTESIMVERFTNCDAYREFVAGNWEKSLQKYQKLAKKKLSQYETELCQFMIQPESQGFHAMPTQCISLPDYRKFKNEVRDLIRMLLCSIPWAVIYCAIIAAISLIISGETVFIFGLSPIFGLILAPLSGIFSYIVFQKKYLKLIRRHRDLEYFEICDHHPRVNKLAAVILSVVLSGSLVLSVTLPLMCDRYYEDHARIYWKGFQYFNFDYRQVQQIYYIHGRYNDYGDLIRRPSYVLLLEDGTTLDLDCSANLKDQEKLVQTLFPELEVVRLESDQNLPNS